MFKKLIKKWFDRKQPRQMDSLDTKKSDYTWTHYMFKDMSHLEIIRDQDGNIIEVNKTVGEDS